MSDAAPPPETPEIVEPEQATVGHDEYETRRGHLLHRETVQAILSPDLMDELSEFTACCDDEGIPTQIAAQLVG